MSNAASRVDDAASVPVLRLQSAADADSRWKRALVDNPETAELLGVFVVGATVSVVRGVA